MRFLSRLLDNSILLPGGYRIGLDPLIGLIPAIGDFFASTLSIWLIYDAARLGISKRILARMTLNVLVESLFGAVPIFGDVVDAVWKANARNMLLVEKEYRPGTRERSASGIVLTIALVLIVIWGTVLGALYLVLRGVLSLFS